MSTTEGFPDYEATTNETGPALDAFVVIYSVLSFVLIAPLVIWGRKYERNRQAALQLTELYNEPRRETTPDFTFDPANDPAHPPQPPQDIEVPIPSASSRAKDFRAFRKRSRTSGMSGIFEQIDRLSFGGSYPDQNPDFVSAAGSQQRNQSRPPSTIHVSHTVQSDSEQQSNVPSAATTSRLYQAHRRPRSHFYDVGVRRWKTRRPIGRAEVIQRAIQTETASVGSSFHGEQRALTRPRHGGSRTSGSRPPSKPSSVRGVSDLASSVLDHQDDVQNGPVVVELGQRPSIRRLRGASFSSTGTNSLPPVVDDISPADAADAADPGRANSIDGASDIEITVCCGPGALWKPRTVCLTVDTLIDLAEPDPEMKRIVSIGFPLTLGAMSESFFRAIIVAFISDRLGTDSMIAYLLVTFLIGFTDELVGAVVDATSTLCSYALVSGQNFLAGQYVQAALVLHVIISVPILVVWALYMEDVVLWLIDSPNTARLAKVYTQIIVIYHFIRSTSRVFTVLFQLTGNELFETRFAVGEGVVTVVTVCCVVSLVDNSRLETVAWIQVIIGAAAFIAKLAYGSFMGWMSRFWKGITSCNTDSLVALENIARTTFPLFAGAFLEYGEWEILMVCFVSNLGPAEVASWALLGVLWKLLEASTEGIGEAGAIRVAYHLGTANPERAKRASYKAVFVAAVQSFVLTSILFVTGDYLSRWLTSDLTLQTMLNEAITYLGIGNLVLSHAMVIWSLIGAQGRYRQATLTILLTRWLITIPMAAIVVYGLNLDINSALASVIVGFATASLILSYMFFRSDWERLSRIICELNALVDPEESDDSEDEESQPTSAGEA